MSAFILDPCLTRIKLTDEQTDHLKAEVKRSGISATKLLKELSDVPDGLSAQMIISWLGERNSARLDHYQYVVDGWASMPNAPKKLKAKKIKRIRLTAERVYKLRAMMKETASPLSFIFKNDKSKIPEGLTYAVVRGWLNGVRTASEDHYNYVLRHFQLLPAAERKNDPTPNSRMNRSVREVELSHNDLLELRRLQNDSGLNPRQLFECQDDVPNGLNYLRVYEWMARKSEWAAEVHLRYVVDVWTEAVALRKGTSSGMS